MKVQPPGSVGPFKVLVLGDRRYGLGVAVSSGVIPEHSYGVWPVNSAGLIASRFAGFGSAGGAHRLLSTLCRDSYARVGAA